MIELQDQHKELRHAFYSLLGNSLVFETYEFGIKFREKLVKQRQHCPLIVCLDGERIEQSGVVYGGKPRLTQYRFGQMPITESLEYKNLLKRKEKLEEFGNLVKNIERFEKKEIRKAKKQLEECRKKHEPLIVELKRDLEKLQKELDNLKAGVSHPDKKTKKPQDTSSKKRKRIQEISDDDDNDDDIEEVESQIPEDEIVLFSDDSEEEEPPPKKQKRTLKKRKNQ